MECLMCRDNGQLGGCPKCGKVYTFHSNEKTSLKSSDLGKLKIPKHYLNCKWDSLILETDKQVFINDTKFINYVKQLNKCYEDFKEGLIPKISALISSPLGYGKTTWAYNCIIEGLKHGYSMVPLIDTAQLRRMLTIASENPNWYNKHDGFTLDNYVNSDILFLTVTNGPEYIYAYETICNIVDIRSRLDKPTIVLSNYKIINLISEDVCKSLKKLLGGGTNANPYKFLIPIEFIEYGGI